MREREIIFIRYRKGLRAGCLEEDLGAKVKVAVEKSRSFTVPRENIVLATGRIAATQGELDRFLREVGERAAEVDLRDVWELVKEESTALSFRDLAELCVPQQPSEIDYAAVLWHLHSDACLFFEPREESFAALAPDDVEARRGRQARQQAEALEEEGFLAWLEGKSPAPAPADFTARQRDWLARLRGFVIEGDESPLAGKAKALIAPVISAGSDVRRILLRKLVERGIFEEHEHLECLRLEVPVEFSGAAAAEAAAFDPLGPEVLEGRVDLRELPVFSVDDATTADIDDAFSLVRADAGWSLGIHITDLAEAVLSGSALDETAQQRVCSLYFPERKIPMLPPALSERSGSLQEGEDRVAISLIVDLDPELRPVESRFVRSIIRSRHRLTYDQVNAILGGESHALSEPLGVLDRLAASLLEGRLAAGAPQIDRPDLEIRFGEEGSIEIEVKQRDTPADRLVAELMILYNVVAARLCRDLSLPAIYRTQPAVSGTPPDDALHPVLRRHLLLKAAAPTDLSLVPAPHRMLGVEIYSQFSSPLRRAIDLVLQRQLAHHLRSGRPLYAAEEITMILHHAEERLKELRRLEPDRVRYWLLKHLEGSIHKTLHGVLLEPGDRQALVELLEYPIRASLQGGSDGRPGDLLELRLAHVDAWSGTIRVRRA
ncbi:MAG: RNB domain-containing ribonuclease [Planctomycetes bacterium]|nr:RNB domain-containing ribonuclease [Planctomycetota bacterium]